MATLTQNDADIEIERELARQLENNNLFKKGAIGISVLVAEDVIRLKGRVNSAVQKTQAEAIATLLAVDRKIINEIRLLEESE